MTNGSGAETTRSSVAGKSLKEQNRWLLWAIVAANSLFLGGVVQANAIRSDGLRAAFTGTQNLVPVALALIITTVMNGLISPEMKARLVYLRWRHALPGHRAFSEYAVRDPRIDLSALEKLRGSPLPHDPVEQNRAWYRIYKTMESDPAVRQAHRDFLLLRDYTGLCVVFIAFYGAAGLFAIPSVKIGLIYLLLLVVQCVVVRQATSNYGIRLVTTVVARWAANEGIDARKVPTRRARGKVNVDIPKTPGCP